MAGKSCTVREQLIEAGIREISEYGLQNFSIRRIAAGCGVSCAAPYKHFKDKEELIAAIIGHIDAIWHARQAAVIAGCAGDTQACIVAVSVEYVRFLVENPQFRSIIMTSYPQLDAMYAKLRGHMTETSAALVDTYCSSVGMPEDVRRRKLYVVRSLIYGAALMFDNGEMEYNEANLRFVECSIRREFELP